MSFLTTVKRKHLVACQMKINSSGSQVKFSEKIPKTRLDKERKCESEMDTKELNLPPINVRPRLEAYRPQCPLPLSPSGFAVQADIFDKEFQEVSLTAVTLTEMKLCREECKSGLQLTLTWGL